MLLESYSIGIRRSGVSIVTHAAVNTLRTAAPHVRSKYTHSDSDSENDSDNSTVSDGRCVVLLLLAKVFAALTPASQHSLHP